jgi:hypothetical protein
MTARPNFFPILSELTILLLGALLVVLSLRRTVGVPSNHLIGIMLGAILVYWSLRAWMRREPAAQRLQTHIRAGSLAIVGAAIIAIPLAPLRYANLLVTLAGGALVVRGLLAGLLSLRETQGEQSQPEPRPRL